MEKFYIVITVQAEDRSQAMEMQESLAAQPDLDALWVDIGGEG